MENNSSETLYKASTDSQIKLLRPSEDKYMCCCITYEWCFNHSGIAAFKEYDDTKINCCTVLDCCSWCLEINIHKRCCIKDINCYLCCCVIYYS